MEGDLEVTSDLEKDTIPIKIGIIGEANLDKPIYLAERMEYAVCTPFGKPSDVIIDGQIEGVNVSLLSRNGRNHDIMPSNINYRANVWAMRKMGCTHILVTNTFSSLRDNFQPGHLVVPHDVIDYTSRRSQTFYDGAVGSPLGVCHVPMNPAFCERTRQHLLNAAQELEMPTRPSGTVLTLEGPRYSTVAENNMFRKWGADLLSMTLCPEAILAKEAGIPYASLGLVTNMECWCAQQPNATTHEIIYIFKKQAENLQKVLTTAIKNMAAEDWAEDILKAKILVCSNFANSK
ncbi:purine nucleoside phosphorylase [Drosophila takahashii]|uniref:purine nucleoside phosphorylase n=1 Tax=Drosophila takahashii TaxID=29030 RepID=UPI0007E78997|nr:purine nucleoside phosphorylase [Drosophila takahashii]